MDARSKLVWGIVAASLLTLGFDEPARSGAQKAPGRLEEPSARKPVVAALELVPAKARAGGALTLTVRVKMADGWHINDAGAVTAGAIPTTLTLRLPRGVTARGEWEYPDALPNPDGEGLVYHEEVVFKRVLEVSPSVAPGPVEAVCEFGYQACNASTCRPPAKLVLRAKAQVSPKARN